MKSLKNVQIIFKVCKVLAMIGFVLCIVGAALIALSLAVLPLFAGMEVNGRPFESYVMEHGGLSLAATYMSMAISLAFTLVGIYLCRITYNYCVHELEDGTPFTHRGVKELRVVALQHIFISLATVILCAIGLAIYHAATHDTVDLDRSGTLLPGIAMLLLSLFFEYGADLRDRIAEVEPLDPFPDPAPARQTPADEPTVEEADQKADPADGTAAEKADQKADPAEKSDGEANE